MKLLFILLSLFWIRDIIKPSEASLMAEMVKNPPAFQETGWGRGGEDTLENGMAIHSNMLPGEFNRQEPDGLQFMGSQKVGHYWVTNTFTLLVLNYEKYQSFIQQIFTECRLSVVNKLDMSSNHMDSTCVQNFTWVLLLYSLLRLRFMILLKGKHLVVKIRKYTLTPKINREV